MFGLFFAWSFLGMPIGHAMLAAAIVYLFLTGQDIGLVASQSLNGLYSSFVLMAVPLFIFSAEIMNQAKITDRLFEFANLLVGRFRGGLAHVNIVASVIFSGMSGSALADAAGPGKLEVDMMVKAGYSPGFSAALSTTSAIIGPIIPPSIPMILYGVVTNTSIGYLFMGGVIPGLLLAGAQSCVVVYLSRRRNFPMEPAPTFATRSAQHLPPCLRSCIPVDHARRHLQRRRDADRSGRGLRHDRAAARLLLVSLLRFCGPVKVLVEFVAGHRHRRHYHCRRAGHELDRCGRADPGAHGQLDDGAGHVAGPFPAGR